LLTALTDITSGSEVTISYGSTLHNGKLATQYGFISPQTMPLAMPLADLPELSDSVLAELHANDDALLKPLLFDLWTALKVSKVI
jgi:hypothetical protein